MNMTIDTVISTRTLENCSRFQHAGVATRYPAAYRRGSKRDHREQLAIERCLTLLPRPGHVLDFPCGTGRLFQLLLKAGFQVSAADASEAMISEVQARMLHDADWGGVKAVYHRNVFGSGFESGVFDAVVCNRLFHHLLERHERVTAMRELARISKGPVVLSFYNSFSISMTWRRLKKWVQGKSVTDRAPVSLNQLRSEADEAGLKVVYKTAVRWGVSAHWYLVLDKAS